MRFSAALFVGVFAAFATAQSTTAGSATGVSTAGTAQSSAQAAITKCLDACAADDVSCRAKCIAVPDPNAAQVNATNNCVADCPKGNGTASDNLQYADCVAACIGANYYTSTGTPQQTNAAAGSGAAATGTAATTGATGTKTGSNPDKTAASGSGSGTGTATGSSASATTTKNAGEALRVTTSAFGLMGLVAALIAL